MIDTHPYDDYLAMAVLRQLDPSDQLEADLTRGSHTGHLALFADWRAVQGVRALSLILRLDRAHGGTPFAVLALANTGQGGVAQAALLSRDHKTFRFALARAAVLIREGMPEFCNAHGIHRVEARCWSEHPTAPRFLERIGFRHEADMPGFGGNGRTTFSQFAWLASTVTNGKD